MACHQRCQKSLEEVLRLPQKIVCMYRKISGVQTGGENVVWRIGQITEPWEKPNNYNCKQTIQTYACTMIKSTESHCWSTMLPAPALDA